jgi:small subunit ribosomal protein S3
VGQKCHPTGLRLGYIKSWDSKWFAERQYKDFLREDMDIRRFLTGDSRLQNASICKVEIERQVNNVTVTLTTAKPGIIIGRAGRGVDDLRQDLEKLTKKAVQLNVLEARRPDLDATLVAERVATQLTRRVSFRRAMRQAIQSTMRANAQGIKIICAGRLAGGEMARTMTIKEGKIPLQTLRADIDYGVKEAPTTYGNIGVKVWIYRGDVLPGAKPEERDRDRGPVRPQRERGGRRRANAKPRKAS